MSGADLPAIAHAQRLILVVGPSGAGKDSVLRHWREALGDGAPAPARRVITRGTDDSEAHEPVTIDEFASLRTEGGLATWWQAHGLDYGVRWSQLAPLSLGRWVVLNGSRAHLPAMRRQAPGLRVIEVTAPALLRARRLATRGREDPAALDGRLTRAVEAPVEADLTLVNDGELRECVERLMAWWTRVNREPMPVK